jgi:hypothetical protein
LYNSGLKFKEIFPEGTKMKPHLASPVSVPGYLEARSDDDTPTSASFPTSTNTPEAASSAIGVSSAVTDLKVSRSSPATVIIIVALIGFAIIALSLFLLYRRRSDEQSSPLTDWRHRKTAVEPATDVTSNQTTTRAVMADDQLPSHDVYEGRVNESQQGLVSQSSNEQPKQSILQKIQQALAGVSKPKAKQNKNEGDVEKGQISDSPEDGNSNMDNSRADGDGWSSRSVSAAENSIQTESSMALHPAVARVKSQKKPGLRPGVSAFSWSTEAPTALPPSHPGLRENPLPPLPYNGVSRRDTTLTTISEDSQPVRHMSINSWVNNVQTRQEKRAQRLQGQIPEEREASFSPDLQAPPVVANSMCRQLTVQDAGSVRLSAMSVDSNAKLPTLETAAMAWHVHQGPGQVEIPPWPRSGSQDIKEENSLQSQGYADNDAAHYYQEEQYVQQNEYAEQEGVYSEQVQYEYTQHGGEAIVPADCAQEYPQQQQQQQMQPYLPGTLQQQNDHDQDQDPDHHHAEIHIHSPSIATAIPEEDWIPNITRYASGTTTTTTTAAAY